MDEFQHLNVFHQALDERLRNVEVSMAERKAELMALIDEQRRANASTAASLAALSAAITADAEQRAIMRTKMNFGTAIFTLAGSLFGSLCTGIILMYLKGHQ